jgi:3-carboxy-cis,cis-muconate cycloisomerase
LSLLLGALAKMAGDIIQLAATDAGEVAEPYVQGRGGSSAMPHKRNPVCSTIIVAAHEAALGHLATLHFAMRAAQERPAGEWLAEWHALPPMFGLLSGALDQAILLAKGLEVYPGRMLANLDATKGLLFAEAVAARLGLTLGRPKAHELVEEAALEVRRTGLRLAEVLAKEPFAAQIKDQAINQAFTLEPHIDAAARSSAAAIEASESVRATLCQPAKPE